MHPRIKILLFALLLLCGRVGAQNSEPSGYSLEQLRAAAKQNFPEFKQKALQQQGYELEIEKLRTLLYPKLNFGLQATWQSAVTSIPNLIPGMDIKSQPRDQYKAYVDVNQVVYDGGLMNKQLALKDAQQQVEQQKIETSLQKVQEQVDFLYFSGLLLQAQTEQLKLVRSTIENKLKQVRGAISNGVALESNAWLLEAELVKNEQQQTEVMAQRQSVARMLAEWTGLPVDPQTAMESPKEKDLPLKPTISRQELRLFALQNRAVDLGIAAVDAKYRPRVFAFSQMGYGRPGLNMLDTQFRPWLVAGVRLSWDIYDWGAGKIEKESLHLQKELVKIQEQAFKRQTDLGLIQVDEDLQKLKKLLQQDDDMIRLRGKIKEISSAQLDNGVITATEYLDRVNEETAAVLAKRLHEIQVLMTQAKYGYITGNN
ncbi:MAG: TolC family protein [Bacteroidia bacterium]